MFSARRLMVFNNCVKFRENINLWSERENCKHTKINNSKRRKTRITVHVFCTSSHDI